jgi:hypothetical protein
LSIDKLKKKLNRSEALKCMSRMHGKCGAAQTKNKMKTNVKLGLSRLPIEKKIVKTRFIVTSMTGNVNFTTPSPTLAVITANVNALETASLAARGGGPDDTANMYAKETVLDLSLKSLGGYVEGIANASPLNAVAIILSAGMDVRAKASVTSVDFAVRAKGQGELKLMHHGVDRGTYEFQMSTDPSSEANWQRIYCGTRGRIVKSGLNSGTRYYFRAAVIDKNGLSPWSTVMNSIVL